MRTQFTFVLSSLAQPCSPARKRARAQRPSRRVTGLSPPNRPATFRAHHNQPNRLIRAPRREPERPRGGRGRRRAASAGHLLRPVRSRAAAGIPEVTSVPGLPRGFKRALRQSPPLRRSTAISTTLLRLAVLPCRNQGQITRPGAHT